jgi:hypothetical protein
MLAFNFMLFFQFCDAQSDLNTLNAILKKNEKLLGKEYVVVVQKDGKNIFLKESEEFKLKAPTLIASASKWFSAGILQSDIVFLIQQDLM